MTPATNDTPCAVITSRSADIAAWRSAQEAVGEESQTDWLLYSLARELPFVDYLKFNRHEEGRHSGADWDWVFVARHNTTVWRVQAKKITAGADHYSELARTNRHGLQIEKLIESAEAENRVPIYAFYRNPVDRAPTACKGSRGAYDGVVLADAYEVYELIKNGRTRIDAQQLTAISIPLSCVLCCPLTTKRGLTGLEERYFRRASAKMAPNRIEPLGHSSVPPTEFFIDRTRQSRLKIPDHFEGEFGPRYGAVRAILLFDLWDLVDISR